MPSHDFDDVYASEYRRLVAELFALTGTFAAAEDLVQESFARAYARWSRVGQLDQPGAWVRRVALNLATSRWRAIRRTATLSGRLAGTAAEPPTLMTDDVLALSTALRALPRRQREAVVLHHLADLTVAEIASQLRVPVATVKSRLQRGRCRLQELLADETEEARR